MLGEGGRPRVSDSGSELVRRTQLPSSNCVARHFCPLPGLGKSAGDCEKPVWPDVPEFQAVKTERLGQLRTVAPILASHVPERTWGALAIFPGTPRFIKQA